MTAVEEFAPAKVNLTLHVTGRRPDGLHRLDSLVAFADIGDGLRAEGADRTSLGIDGPYAAGLDAGAGNLVLRAARLLAPDRTAALRLTKRLPVAAGIGGGSADAAAALRALSRLWRLPVPSRGRLVSLGADVPVCMACAGAWRMQGVGGDVSAAPALPDLGLVLVNPGVALATPAVFAALDQPENPPMRLPGGWRDAADLAGWLARQRNDLQAPAAGLAPVIGDALRAIGAAGALWAGMSGSGATCVGIFPPGALAAQAANGIARASPGWWCASGRLL